MTRYSPEYAFMALAFREVERHEYAARVLKYSPSSFSKLWASEVKSHQTTMERYAGALVDAWFRNISNTSSVATTDIFLSMFRFIEQRAKTLAEIRENMKDSLSAHYLDEHQRYGMLPAIVTAARRMMEGAGDTEWHPLPLRPAPPTAASRRAAYGGW
jgi:hypothetical protein